jgi:hypothetical protein
MVIRKAIQTGNKLQIVLYGSARDSDVTSFFRLHLNIDGKRNFVAEIVSENAEKEGTLFAEGLIEVREKKELTVFLPNNNRVSVLELSDGNMKRSILIE